MYNKGVTRRMQLIYYNDTGRDVLIHSATYAYGCTADRDIIRPSERCLFTLPEGVIPEIKMWDYGDKGLSILVTPITFGIKSSDC